ncbi:Multidrug resistance protein [Ascochyta clinopodiicola]|nr:Multidrug resistance protein [Ascochyta clinopodiicola]
MNTAFRGEAVYTAEVDAHFPQLSVGDTLYFAALARAPRNIPGGVDRERYAAHLRDVIMAMFGISHTANTRVGDDFVRGVSGGERKRVTIAEATLSFAPLQCWDNSTRGLDSANAVEFCKTLRTQCDVFGTSACVAIYQAPQAAYDVFDKVTVLYEGQQIYFGPASKAREYFQRLGFECPESQTTPDFLTSMTSPSERRIKPGFENATPRTSDEFARCWKDSVERQSLLRDIEDVPLVMITINFFEALIIASIFYNLPSNTASFFMRGGVLFMMVLLNAFGSILEIMSLYAKRQIVEKHNRYALYHPSAEAMASMIMDMPYKIVNSLIVNCTLYFMAGLRREAGPFFFFFLIAFTMTLSMSMFFRLFASMTKTIAQALAPSSIILMCLILYTGFAIPVRYMRGWASWIRWVNPVSYGFESVMVNEFHDRQFACASFIPSGPAYESVAADQRACAVQGSEPGLNFVSGTTYVETAFSYQWDNRWRNYGVIVAFTIFLFIAHLGMTELVASERSKGEVLVFRRSKMAKSKERRRTDEEAGNDSAHQGEKIKDNNAMIPEVQKQQSVFHWEGVNYEVQIKSETRKILDSVDGWIRPGTLTALMGVSGAGKTTLLDVLASRTTTGVISGGIFVDGRERDESFQRKTGYAMQQDLHLATSTVREALEFSALLRQPTEYSRSERVAYVDHVIDLLDMTEYADAVVGIPGSGLNVEQRKRLTIGVELAARPKLLLFLDEPTSGLDSQTSWSICDLMEKLTRNGQAILCTVHQPSSLLFQRFDRILLLAKGGRTVYFGDVGRNSKVLLDYFARNGGPEYDPGQNPAEYMLEAIGAAPGAQTSIDWPQVWKDSHEYQEVQTELSKLRDNAYRPSAVMDSSDESHQAFAASFTTQFLAVGMRVAQQYWRTPSYIYSKAILTVGCSLLIGFSFFKNDNTQQGLQNQMFGVFVFLFVVIQLIYQIMPMFVTQRTLYEARERQSKTYAWQTFVLSNIVIELAWNAVSCFSLTLSRTGC